MARFDLKGAELPPESVTAYIESMLVELAGMATLTGSPAMAEAITAAARMAARKNAKFSARPKRVLGTPPRDKVCDPLT